ncbi:unnamed protein product [Sphagnum balticum]
MKQLLQELNVSVRSFDTLEQFITLIIVRSAGVVGRGSVRESGHAGNALESELDESCDIEEFKEEIELKWQLSTANKFYSFPFTPELLEYSSDESLDSLRDVQEYYLINQNTKTVDSRRVVDKFKIKDKRKADQHPVTNRRDTVMNRLTTLMEGFRSQKADLQGCLDLVRRKRDKSLSKER